MSYLTRMAGEGSIRTLPINGEKLLYTTQQHLWSGHSYVLIKSLIHVLFIILLRRVPDSMQLTELCMENSGSQIWLHMGISREL